MKIAILRETRRWKDRRTAITPHTAKLIMSKWNDVQIFAQPSEIRAFKDEEFENAGVKIVEDVSHCDVLIGVKEVADEELIDNKTYIMFAHVAKMQEHNRMFFKEISRKKITLLDYEYFTDKSGARLVAFGHWAGVVGAYYALKGIMKKYKDIEIPHPSKFYDANELFDFLKTFKIPELKILITGNGRVAQGAADVLRNNGIREVSGEEFLNIKNNDPVFCILPFHEYVKPKAGSTKTYDDFYTFPKEFESTFKPFTKVADVYIPCHFWNQESPVFFTKKDMSEEDFNISLVTDISCDVDGPIPSTIRSSEHDSPFYDVGNESLNESPPFSDKNNITVMAVDNLPTALPINASESFAGDLLENVFPSLFGDDKDGVINRATILKDGKLTENYKYLDEFLNK